MNADITNGYRKLGIGEAILEADYQDVEGGLDPVPTSMVGCLVSQDDLVDYYRDTLNRPLLTFDIEPSQPVDRAKTDDADKAPLAHVPWAAVREMALVQQYGQKKYGDWSNYRKGMEVSRNLSCAIRHIASYMEGIDLDSESGRPHLAHAFCRIGFVLQNLADGVAVDDRYKRT